MSHVTSPADLEALKGIQDAIAAGEDPFGDDEFGPEAKEDATEDAVKTEPAEEKADDKPAEESEQSDNTDKAEKTDEAEDKTKTDDEPDQAALEELASDEPLQVQRYTAKVPDDYKAQRTTLLTEKAQALQKLMDGELTAEEYMAIDIRVADSLEELSVQRIRAETLQEANAQAQASEETRTINSIVRQGKSDGIDYAKDVSAAKQFDMALAMLKADPENASKDFSDLAGDAHKSVLALRGMNASAKSEEPADPADKIRAVAERRKVDSKAPITLRNIPSAASTQPSGDWRDALGRLSGPAYQEAFSRLSPAQKAQMLDE